MARSHPHPSELDERQRRIHRRLGDLVSPGTAKWFHNACRIMARHEDHHAASHLVAHCLREVEGSLRQALRAVIDQVREQKKAAEDAKNTRTKGKQEKPEKKDSQAIEIRAAVEFLGLPPTERATDIWLSLAGAENEGALHKRTHRDNLLDPRPIDDAYKNLWEGVQHLLDRVLDRYEARFVEVLGPLEQKLAAITKPTSGDAKWFGMHVPNNQRAQQQALACCKSVEWLAVLHDAGYFARPPDVEPGDEPGTFRYPPWPAATYLQELAPQAPDRVAAIIASVAGQGNPYVQAQLAFVALALPPARAASWSATFVAVSAGRLIDSSLADALVKVVRHLADGGEPDAAVALARFLFEPQPDPDTEVRREAAGLPHLPEVRPRFDLWHYEEGLRELVPALARGAGLPALRALAALLDQALRLRRVRDEEPGQDHSTIWRSTIHGDGDLSHGPLNALVSAVRDTAEALVAAGRASLADVLATLEQYYWESFRRLELHVLTKHLDAKRIAAALKEWVECVYRDPPPEYFHLAAAQFSALASTDRDNLLSIIESGPMPAAIRDLLNLFEARSAEFFGRAPRPVTDDDVARFIRDWQLCRLAAVHADLPDRLRQIYDRLSAEFGRSGEPEPRGVVTRWGGRDPGDPEARKQLRQLTFREILDLVARASAEKQINGFVRADLLTVLVQLIAESPDQLAAYASELISLPGDVRQRVLAAVGTALDQGRSIPWPQVIELCRAQVTGSFDPAELDEDEFPIDRPLAVARLLRDGLDAECTSPIPADLRKALWHILDLLMANADPAPDRPPIRSAYVTAINSVRGVALEAVIAYAFWVWRQIAAAGTNVRVSFDVLPEVRTLLGRHLELDHDRSPAVRAIFGFHLVDLAKLDESWLRANLARMFPSEQEQLLDAAWTSFITHSPVPLNLLAELRPLYVRAIESLSTSETEESREYRRRLAEHVMLYYWMGRLQLNDELVVALFSRTPADVRRHAVGGAGRMLYKEDKPADDVLARLRTFWDWRLQAVSTIASADDRRTELEDFGYWFLSGHFDDVWAFDHLIATVSSAGQIEPDSLVAERVAELAPQFPEPALAFAEHAVTGARNLWRIYASREHFNAIVSVARGSGDAGLMRRADELVSRMSARGT